MRTQLLAACVAVAALAGCGGDDDPEPTATQKTPAAAADRPERRSRTTCSTTRSRLQGDTAKLAAEADAYYALAKDADFDYGKLLADNRDEVADLVKDDAGHLHRRQPGVRGDGGRGRRRAVARRLRRDHRRGQRQVRSRERRAVHGQDAGRARRSSSPATSSA